MRTNRAPDRNGFAVVTALLLSIVLMALLATMFALTNLEVRSSSVNADITSGFYAAEAGLNVRGELIRAEFQGYRRPAGASPAAGPSDEPCVGANVGSGDFACQTLDVNARTVTTYVVEDERNNDPDDIERTITVPPGELFAGLSAIQYRYSVFSEAVPPGDDRPEALLEMVFRVRLVPLFQFAAFYDKDLEIAPGPDMTLGGRVHANGDLYLSAGATLTIGGQVTAAMRSGGTGGNVHRGRKDRNACEGTVRVRVPGNQAGQALPCSGSSYVPVPNATIDTFQGQIRTRLDTLTVPPPEEFGQGGLYWNEADIRIALDLRNGVDNATPVVLRPELSAGQPQIDPTLTSLLTTCLAADQTARGYTVRPHAGIAGSPTPPQYGDAFPPAGGLPGGDEPGGVRAVEWSNSFRDRRENSNDNARNSFRLMLEVDTRGVLDCLHQNRSDFFAGRDLVDAGIDTARNGGLVWYLSVLGPNATDASSGYGVRVRNGDVLAATVAGAPEINGLTIVSDQALFTSGNFNGAPTRPFTTDPGAPDPADPLWRPAALMADTIHVLSGRRGAFPQDNQNAYSVDGLYTTDAGDLNASGVDRHRLRALGNRVATPTTVAAAFLANTDTTGGRDGTAGQGGAYNGGLENYPRMHERWTNIDLRYAGSFVSLGEPERSTGGWPGTGSPRNVYDPPVRRWVYDARFNDASNLPPLTPRFVYLVQERFIRDFER